MARRLVGWGLACVVTFVAGCTSNSFPSSSGSGKVITRDVQVSSFSCVEVSGAFEVNVSPGDEEKVTLRAPEDVVDYIDVGASDDVLHIGPGGVVNVQNTTLEIDVTVRSLSGIDVRGTSQVHVSGELKGKTLRLLVSGASRLDASIRYGVVNVALLGASEVELTGVTKRILVKESGADRLSAEELRAGDLHIQLLGTSSAIVWVSKTISATLSGASSLRYRGDPRFVHRDVSVASSITKM